jgi:hypothetical protein
MAGSWPSVAITKEGYVVIIWSNSFFKQGSVLRYSTGTINLGGGTDQLIDFKLKDGFRAAGSHAICVPGFSNSSCYIKQRATAASDFAWNSYKAVAYLSADTPPDPDRTPNYVLVVPNINRQLLDLLFSLAYMRDDFSKRSIPTCRIA